MPIAALTWATAADSARPESQQLSGNCERFEASSLGNAPLHTPLNGRRRWLEPLICGGGYRFHVPITRALERYRTYLEDSEQG
jgi:hypothetical protein